MIEKNHSASTDQQYSNDFLVNEMSLLIKVKELNNLDSLNVCDLIKKYGGTLRTKYYYEIAAGEIFAALGFLNASIQGLI